MRRVELIYDLECPNVEKARQALLQAFAEVELEPSWTEWDRKSPESPSYVRQYGSPTILVDGQDIAEAEPMDGFAGCRLYDHGPGGLKGVPPAPRIAAALANECPSAASLGRSGRGWLHALASLPGAGSALLPVGVCPACWPAYAGVLGSLGLGFTPDSTYTLPVTVTLLGLALFALAFRARRRRGFAPFVLGIASVASVLVFKFLYVIDPLVYAGLFGLLAASVWNAWPKTREGIGRCPKCVRQEPALETKHAP